VADLQLSALRERQPLNEPVGDASVVPLIAVQLPGTRFIHARSEKAVSGEIDWNKTAAHKFCTVRHRGNVCTNSK
jgi:hypothetical protein